MTTGTTVRTSVLTPAHGAARPSWEDRGRVRVGIARPAEGRPDRCGGRGERRAREVVEAAGPGERRRHDRRDPAGARREDHGPIRDEDRLGDAVRHEDDGRRGLLPQPEQLDVEPLAGQRVERAEGLVEEEDRWPEGERPRERDPLTHPARQAMRASRSEAGQPDEPEHLEGAHLAFIARNAGQLERVGDVGQGVPPRQEARLLEREPDRPIWTRHGPPLDFDRAGVGLEQAADDPEERALAAAVRADDRHDLVGSDLEVETVERDEGRAVGGRERASDARQADRRRDHRSAVGGGLNSRRRSAPARAARPPPPAGRPCRSAPTAGRGPAGRSDRRPLSGGRSAGAGRARR